MSIIPFVTTLRDPGGGSLQNQARIVMSYLWCEEPI